MKNIKILSLFIIFLFTHLGSIHSQQTHMNIRHVGEIDKPIKELLIIPTSEDMFIDGLQMTQIGIDSIEYKRILHFVKTSKIAKKDTCNFYGHFGSFLIKTADDHEITCYVLYSRRKSERFFVNLLKKIDIELNERFYKEIKMRLIRIIGYKKYEKKYSNSFPNGGVNH